MNYRYSSFKTEITEQKGGWLLSQIFYSQHKCNKKVHYKLNVIKI